MDSWKIYGLTVVVLFVKMFAMVLVQGYGRFKHRGFTNPEDAVMFDRLFGSKPDATKQSELVDRAQSVLRNDGENILIFLFLIIKPGRLKANQRFCLTAPNRSFHISKEPLVIELKEIHNALGQNRSSARP